MVMRWRSASSSRGSIKRLDQRPRGKRLCEIGEASGSKRSLANGGFVVLRRCRRSMPDPLPTFHRRQRLLSIWPDANGSGAWPASSHAGISTDGIDFLGSWGLRVPAVTISPPSNFVRAKSLASASVLNVLVRRGFRRCITVPLLGTSKVTYQVWFIPDPSRAEAGHCHDDLVLKFAACAQ